MKVSSLDIHLRKSLGANRPVPFDASRPQISEEDICLWLHSNPNSGLVPRKMDIVIFYLNPAFIVKLVKMASENFLTPDSDYPQDGSEELMPVALIHYFLKVSSLEIHLKKSLCKTFTVPFDASRPQISEEDICVWLHANPNSGEMAAHYIRKICGDLFTPANFIAARVSRLIIFVISFLGIFGKPEAKAAGQEQNQDHKERMNGEIERRIKAAWYTYSNTNEVLKKIKYAKLRANIFNTTVLAAMLYGCEIVASPKHKKNVSEQQTYR
ncbi:hypothetical protein DdX_16007 [Ditylenchus destructor]|uniref:Uncharacterized protein n=1 Tax=Ditylenchus destructor TaxID=166010 RepID=A0AAD4R0C5_9BILA|nr:hypothetical protein DdX_16007 [Ditylenchus destructor]